MIMFSRKTIHFGSFWDILGKKIGTMWEHLGMMDDGTKGGLCAFAQINGSEKEPLGITRGNGNEPLLNGALVNFHVQ